MVSYHFYEAEKKDTDEIFEILKNFEKEVEELNYPKVDNDKLKSRIFYFLEHGKILMVKNLDKNKLIGLYCSFKVTGFNSFSGSVPSSLIIALIVGL